MSLSFSPLPPAWSLKKRDYVALLMVIIVAISCFILITRVSLISDKRAAAEGILLTPSGTDEKTVDNNITPTDGNSSITLISSNKVDQGNNGKPVLEENQLTSEEEVKVHVVGGVNNPGVVTVKTTDRVNDAIMLAGGFAPNADESSVNLAQIVQDGQQLRVGLIGENLTPESSISTVAGESNSKTININTASEKELEELPGIGPKTAATIYKYREEHGPFASLDHLQEVGGIGQKTVDSIREAASV